jgi:hypothetical protein
MKRRNIMNDVLKKFEEEFPVKLLEKNPMHVARAMGYLEALLDNKLADEKLINMRIKALAMLLVSLL